MIKMNSKKGDGLWGDKYKKQWYTYDTCWRAHNKSTNWKKKHGQEGYAYQVGRYEHGHQPSLVTPPFSRNEIEHLDKLLQS